MRRWCFALTVMLVLLTSCAVTPKAPPVGDGFRCAVDICFDGTEVSGVLDRTQTEKTTLTLTNPKEVEGLTMIWDGGSLSLQYAGMSLDVEKERVPAGSAVGVLCEVLDKAVGQSEQDGISQTVKGVAECGEYELCFDPETGYPLTLTVPSMALSVVFDEWEINR